MKRTIILSLLLVVILTGCTTRGGWPRFKHWNEMIPGLPSNHQTP